MYAHTFTNICWFNFLLLCFPCLYSFCLFPLSRVQPSIIESCSYSFYFCILICALHLYGRVSQSVVVFCIKKKCIYWSKSFSVSFKMFMTFSKAQRPARIYVFIYLHHLSGVVHNQFDNILHRRFHTTNLPVDFVVAVCWLWLFEHLYEGSPLTPLSPLAHIRCAWSAVPLGVTWLPSLPSLAGSNAEAIPVQGPGASFKRRLPHFLPPGVPFWMKGAFPSHPLHTPLPFC